MSVEPESQPPDSSQHTSEVAEPQRGGRHEDRAPIVVLASGTGTLLEAILDAADAEDYPASVVGVVADRPCRAIEVAQARGIPVAVVAPTSFSDRSRWDRALTEAVSDHRPALVVTAGFMRILGSVFLAAHGGRIVNSHPALLPAFPGAHGVREALDYGVKITGATVHLVDDGVDTGPILAQSPVPVEPDDDEQRLHERIKAVERALLPQVIGQIVTKGVVSDGRKAHIRE